MAVTLDLRLIDHEHLVVRGCRIVNQSVKKNDPEILRACLASLPVEVNRAVVRFHKARLARLRQLKAPQVVVENEERFLQRANGQAYRPKAFENYGLDELRKLLGTWCWQSFCFSIPSSNELHWFLEPQAGPKDFPLHPFWQDDRGTPTQSVFSKALNGAGDYPRDALGDPIVRTCGSAEKGCYGYNPPRTAKSILRVLGTVDPSTWDEHIPLRCTLYRQTSHFAEMDNAEIEERVQAELAEARETFPVLVSAYTKAVESRFGVSCEYSL